MYNDKLTVVPIDKDLHLKLKIFAAINSITIKGFVEDAILQAITKAEKKQSKN